MENNSNHEADNNENEVLPSDVDLESGEPLETLVSDENGDETQKQEIPNGSPKPPSLQVNPPSLEVSSINTDKTHEEKDTNEKQPPIVDEGNNDEGSDDESSNLSIDDKEEQPSYDVPLVLARISRFYGPFDYSITKKVCQGTRLQRITLVGKLRKKISWINPLDAGRAMIIMGDDKVKQGQYNITGFNATGSELVEAMEQINHSQTKIRRKVFLFSNITTKIKLMFSKLGFINRIQFDEIYGLNREQVYSDHKAQTEWNWKPKYDLIITSKDSLNWFVNHVL